MPRQITYRLRSVKFAEEDDPKTIEFYRSLVIQSLIQKLRENGIL